MRLLSAPLRMGIFITHKCNLTCKHCSAFPTREYKDEFNTSEWINFFDVISNLKIFEVDISGGEPFVRNDILTLLEYLNKKRIPIRINTNGTLIDKEIAQKISKLNMIKNIQVSLEGSNSEINDKIRGNGSFEKALIGIKNLKKYYKNFLTTFVTVTKYNYNDLENIVKLCKKLKLNSINFSYMVPVGNAIKNSEEIALSIKENVELIQKIGTLYEKYGGIVTGSLLQAYHINKKLELKSNEIDENAKANYFSGCNTTLNYCNITATGDVIPCDRLWDIKAGNIRERDFQDIWINSDVFNNFRKRFSMTLNEIPECKICKYKSICNGGCIASFYYLTGSTIGFDPLSCYKVLKGEK